MRDVAADFAALCATLGLPVQEDEDGLSAWRPDRSRGLTLDWDGPGREGFFFRMRTAARPEGYAIWLLMRAHAGPGRGDPLLDFDTQIGFVTDHWQGWLADEAGFAAAYDRLNAIP